MSVYSKDECRQRIELINRRKPDFLAAASRSGYVCPLCGNGSGPDGTGLCRNPRNGRWHCFRCGFDGDVLDLFRVRFRIENWGALLAAAALWYGLEPSKERGTDAVPRRNAADSPDPDDVRLPQLTLAAVGTDASADRETDRHRPDSFHAAERSSRDLPPEDCAPADYLDFYRRAAAASTGGYLLGRGISLKVQRRFLIGFVRNWRSDRAVIRALTRSGLFDAVLIDMGVYMNEKALSIFEAVQKILLIEKPDTISREKMNIFLAQQHILEVYGRKMVRILNCDIGREPQTATQIPLAGKIGYVQNPDSAHVIEILSANTSQIFTGVLALQSAS